MDDGGDRWRDPHQSKEEASWSASDGGLHRVGLARRRPVRGVLMAMRAGRRVDAAAATSAPATLAPPEVSASHRQRGSGPARLRDRSGGAERLLRDGLRPAVQAVGGVHQAVPERDLGHQPGPVHQPDDRDAAPALGRQPAGPHPPAVDGLARQGRPAAQPRRLCDGVRLGPVARRPARAEPGGRGRHARLRLAVRDGPQLQPDRRLLQQGNWPSRSG